jgi:hypothetical protein
VRIFCCPLRKGLPGLRFLPDRQYAADRGDAAA